MVNNQKVITLCGSTKFKDEFLQIQKDLTLKGNIVLCPCIFEHSGDSHLLNLKTKKTLIDVHKKMIDLSDEIFVINKNGYIGSSTRSEIEYAIAHGKIVDYLEGA